MRIKKILGAFPDKHILVVGDIILDHYIWGRVDRISPEAPVPIVEVERESYLLGGAANVAHNIVSLGARATIAGVAGKDYRGEILASCLKDKQINTEGIVYTDRQTTVKTRVIAHSQQVVRFDRENTKNIATTTFHTLCNYLTATIDTFDAVIVSDYKKGVVTARLIRFLLDAGKRRDLFVAVDPKVGHFPFYKGVSLITPNKKEAQEGSGIEITDEKSLEKAGRILCTRSRWVLITRGEEGMSLFEGDSVHHLSTTAREVFDVTGAGDTVIATCTLAHAAGATLLEAAEIANHAAGIVVGEVGTAVTTTKELGHALGCTIP